MQETIEYKGGYIHISYSDVALRVYKKEELKPVITYQLGHYFNNSIPARIGHRHGNAKSIHAAKCIISRILKPIDSR